MYGPRDPGSYTLTVTELPTRVTPGNHRINALAINLGEAASFSITSSGTHFYEVQLEEGITYSIHVSLDTLVSSTVTLTDNQGIALDYKLNFGDSVASRIVWTATRSGSFFVTVSGLLGPGSYTLTVMEGDIPSPPLVQQPPSPPVPTATPTLAGSPSPTLPSTPIPVLVVFSETCSAVVPPDDAIQECSVQAIGPGRFTASIRTGKDVGFRWRAQVNEVRRLPKEVVCNRTQGVGDGEVICEVPEGTHTEVEISGTLLSNYGSANSNEIIIKADFLQYEAPPEPKRLAHSAVCSAVVLPATHQRCSVHAIGPGRFTASIRTGSDVPYSWRVQVNDVRRLPKEVVCNRTEGVGDGDVTCDVPEGVRTEVEISGQLSSVGSGTPAEITIKVDFLQ